MSAVKSEYMLFFRGPEWDKGLSPEELQQVMSEVMNWFQSLQRQGKVKAGQPLPPEGRIIAGQKGRPVLDGPFVESKETVGGYLLLRETSLEEALAIARSNPTLQYGIRIELRPVLEECPIFQRAHASLALAEA